MRELTKYEEEARARAITLFNRGYRVARGATFLKFAIDWKGDRGRDPSLLDWTGEDLPIKSCENLILDTAGLIVFDLDVWDKQRGEKKDPYKAWRRFCEVLGPLDEETDPTIGLEHTWTGGKHIILRLPPDVVLSQDDDIIPPLPDGTPNIDFPPSSIDIRTGASTVVMAPSRHKPGYIRGTDLLEKPPVDIKADADGAFPYVMIRDLPPLDELKVLPESWCDYLQNRKKLANKKRLGITRSEEAPNRDRRTSIEGLSGYKWDKEEINRLMEGKEADVYSAVAGISWDLLDGKGHPCPVCGGTDRFFLYKDKVLRCRKCGVALDGVAAVEHFGGMSFLDALKGCAEYLDPAGVSTNTITHYTPPTFNPTLNFTTPTPLPPLVIKEAPKMTADDDQNTTTTKTQETQEPTQKPKRKPTPPMSEVCQEDFDFFKAGGPALIKSGFSTLDEILGGGLFPEFYFVGAVPSIGKTSFVLQLAAQIARTGRRVLFFALEMPRNVLLARLISMSGGLMAKEQFLADDKASRREMFFSSITSKNLLEKGRAENVAKFLDAVSSTRTIQKGTWERYDSPIGEEPLPLVTYKKAKADFLENIAPNLVIVEQPGGMNSDEVRWELAAQFETDTPPDVVILDYIQFLQPPKNVFLDGKMKFDAIIQDVYKLQKEVQIPFVVVSSVNRQNYSKEIGIEAFKETGLIEYAAENLLGLQYKALADIVDQAKTETDKTQKARRGMREEALKGERDIELVLLKNRNGPTGATIDYSFFPRGNFWLEGESDYSSGFGSSIDKQRTDEAAEREEYLRSILIDVKRTLSRAGGGKRKADVLEGIKFLHCTAEEIETTLLSRNSGIVQQYEPETGEPYLVLRKSEVYRGKPTPPRPEPPTPPKPTPAPIPGPLEDVDPADFDDVVKNSLFGF